MKFSIRDLLWLTVVVGVALAGAINYYKLRETNERLINEREEWRKEQIALIRKRMPLPPVARPTRSYLRDMYPQSPGPPRPRLNDVLLNCEATSSIPAC